MATGGNRSKPTPADKGKGKMEDIKVQVQQAVNSGAARGRGPVIKSPVSGSPAGHGEKQFNLPKSEIPTIFMVPASIYTTNAAGGPQASGGGAKAGSAGVTSPKVDMHKQPAVTKDAEETIEAATDEANGKNSEEGEILDNDVFLDAVMGDDTSAEKSNEVDDIPSIEKKEDEVKEANSEGSFNAFTTAIGLQGQKFDDFIEVTDLELSDASRKRGSNAEDDTASSAPKRPKRKFN